MTYTVKQLANLAGVSTRTLHYYDEIGLLKPSSVGSNGYRHYDEEAVLRLQQIMFFKELGFGLKEIKEVVDQPDFDVLQALETHRSTLQERVDQLKRLIDTVEKTILHYQGDITMDDKNLFEGFSEEKQKEYEVEIRQRYGDKDLKESQRLWKSYSQEKKDAIRAEGEVIFTAIGAYMSKGYDSVEVQSQIKALHEHMGYFYECSYERLLGLGQLYNEHPDFIARFQQIHPDMPEFLQKAIAYYCRNEVGAE
ncbi:MAG: MerR family transcriptional regulator [Anaerolineales bacterium]|jgi:DNA-binding transcriptional MerR regulator